MLVALHIVHWQFWRDHCLRDCASECAVGRVQLENVVSIGPRVFQMPPTYKQKPIRVRYWYEPPTSHVYESVESMRADKNKNYQSLESVNSAHVVARAVADDYRREALSHSSALPRTFARGNDNEEERTALEEFFGSTGGPNWHNRTHWKSSVSVCVWFGVRCNKEGRVDQLVLNENDIEGTLPRCLQRLPFLASLHLNSNDLAG